MFMVISFRSIGAAAHLDEADFVAALAQGFHDPVDAVAREAADDGDAPVLQCLDQDVGGGRCHRVFLSPGIFSGLLPESPTR
jgi:hypothetical protein